MMNVLRSMFGVCSSSAEKGEVHDTIRRVFGNELVMKDNTDKHNQRSKYVSHVRDNLSKVLDAKVTSHKTKSTKKHPVVTPSENTESTDDRPGRIGPKLVVFDASTGTGRLVLVGDERVSVQGLSSFATIRATACVYSGKWMYEVQLGTKGIMQVGWCTATCTFSMDTGVGDTAHSYAYDGGRVRKWNVATSQYGQAWLPGDVIASCIDLDKGTLEYYRNGVSLGMAFNRVTRGSGLAYFPAVSLAMQEHLYANFGHVPFIFPVEGFSPLQAPPTKDCLRASILFKSLDALLDELSKISDLKTSVSAKSSKAKSISSKAEEEVALRIHSSSSVYSPRASPHSMVVAQSAEMKKMSKKAFLMSLARLVVSELGTVLRVSYVVVSELLPRFRGSLGLKSKVMHPEPSAVDFYQKAKEEKFNGLARKFLSQPQPRLCLLLDLLWTFLEEAALCDVLEHCVVRECLMYDLVSPDMNFVQQTEGIYVLCGLMQHRDTRHYLVKYVFFNKISFDNFLNVKCPDESVLRSVIRKPWWQRPTSVEGETDPRIMEFLLMLLDNTDGTNMVPSTRKIFLEKFRRYIMDNCILDMRLFNVSRNTPAISWCCHARLLSAVLKLWNENPLGITHAHPHLPARTFIDGELDFYNVDRLGGVLPFLVRTLRRQDLVSVLGEGNPFIQSFEPNYNRAGGIDTGVSEMAAGSPGLATLPQVISSIARFMHPQMTPLTNRTAGETALALKGTRSMMPGAGAIDARNAYLRLLDGLLALYHGAAIKHSEKLCELRDNQLDMADCLHDIEQRMAIVTNELQAVGGANGELTDQDKMRRQLTENILNELRRSKAVYEEKLNTSALQMGWVIGAIWTRQRQLELAKHFAGALHSLRIASDPDYAAHARWELQIAECFIFLSTATAPEFTESLFAFIPEYHVDAMLELCNTLRLYMHPTVPVQNIPEWEELVVSCATFLCTEFADPRIVLASSRESLVQTLASFATQPATMRAIERVPLKQQMCMVEELVRPYQNRAWAQSNWVLVRFWHGSGFGFRHRQWPHLAARYGDREPTVNNLGAKVDAGLMSQCFEWEELVVSCATFLCTEFADPRIVLASSRESLVQTLASFATQPATMRAIERVPLKQQMCMVEELVRPYQNRAWAQSNWVLVRFWHGSGFGFRHRQWPHLAARYGDREPTVNNLGAKVDAGLMSQCFGPCPSEVIQGRVREYLESHPKEAAQFLNSLLSQLNWAFSEFFTMMQEMDRVQIDSHLEPRQIKLCATCFDLYHGLARALEMTLALAPELLTKPEASENQNELLLGRTCQILMAVVSRVCVREGGGAGFNRLVARGLPDTDRVHYYVALAPVAGCLIRMLDPKLPDVHLNKVTNSLVSEPLFRLDGLQFMLEQDKSKHFSFYKC
nr:E3 ubiquitin-protein ligase RNF123-like [Danaus plexippus plexippus]